MTESARLGHFTVTDGYLEVPMGINRRRHSMNRMSKIVSVVVSTILTVTFAYGEELRIVNSTPRSKNDGFAVNTHGWAHEAAESHVVLMSPRRLTVMTRVNGKLKESDAGLDATSAFMSIGNFGPSHFGVLEVNKFNVYELRLGTPDNSIRNAFERGMSVTFRSNNRISLNSNVIVDSEDGLVVLMPSPGSNAAIHMAEWHPKTKELYSDGTVWNADRALRSYKMPGLAAVCRLGEKDRYIVARRRSGQEPASLAVFQWKNSGIVELTSFIEDANEKSKGLFFLSGVGATKDEKYIVTVSARVSSVFSFNTGGRITHRGCFCAKGDVDWTGRVNEVDGLVAPLLMAVGRSAEQIAFVDDKCNVSICRFDPNSSQLETICHTDLSRSLMTDIGTPLSMVFAGRYLRLMTTRFSLIELEM